MPEVSPAILAHFRNLVRGPRFRSFIATKMRRWLGFRPSRTSGRARDTMTLIA